MVAESYKKYDTAAGGFLEPASHCPLCFCCSSCSSTCVACDTAEEKILDRVCRVLDVPKDTEDIRCCFCHDLAVDLHRTFSVNHLYFLE